MCALDHRIMDVAARKHVGDLMADEFADAQLALRTAGGMSASAGDVASFYFVLARAWTATLLSAISDFAAWTAGNHTKRLFALLPGNNDAMRT